MKKREQGILTVEASIVLTLSVLFILFLFSFARVYNAQSLVSHAVLQSSDAVALESYLRESVLTGDEEQVTELANRYVGTTASISAENFTSLRSADVPKIAKEKFIYAVGKNEAEADEKLKKLGVKDGLAGIDFSSSRMDLGNDDVIVYVTYTIEMQFPVFGMDEITVTKAAKSKTFGDILFGLSVVSEDPIMGSAAGSGSYKFGTEVQISATPNYGYKFKSWDDGNTENPRTVTVTGAKTYIAKFEASEFGVNLISSPTAGGSTSGGGTYKYLNSATINATPATGYHFSKWSIYKHRDGTTTSVTTQSTTLNIDQSFTCTAHFEKNNYTVKVETSGASGGSATIVYNSSNKSSITAPYQSSFKLSAPNISGYEFLGWKEKGASSYFSTSSSVQMNVPAKNVTYVAEYKSSIRTVKFYDYDGNLYATRTVASGKSLGSSMPGNPKKIGKIFSGWKNFSASTKVTADTNVYGNWKGCSGHVWGRCGVTHTATTACYLSAHSKSHKVSKFQCIVCVNCGIFEPLNGNTTCPCSGMNKYLDRSKIGPVHLCYTKTGCCNLWDRTYPYPSRVYNVHDIIGYP